MSRGRCATRRRERRLGGSQRMARDTLRSGRAEIGRPRATGEACNADLPQSRCMSTGPIDVARLVGYLDDKAVRRLDEYFNSGVYTGGQFERFAGGGDRSQIAERLTSEDIVAVSLLGVRIPGRAALDILDSQAGELSACLRGIPMALDLWEATEEIVGPDSAAARLWQRLVDVPGIGWVTAGKLIARKRPRLIPVYDRVVRYALGRAPDEEWWRPLRNVLNEHPEVILRLERLREGTGLGHALSLLRVLDVCIWMGANGKPEPVPDAET